MEKDGRSGIFRFFSAERKRFESFVRQKMRDISEMDAQDMVEEVMLALLNRADPAGHVENLTAYVYRSLGNKVADLARGRRRTESLQGLTEEEGETSLMALLLDKKADVAGTMESREFRQSLREALDRLPPAQRAVFVATEFGGHTFKELSMRWNEPVGTLLSRKCRAVKALREALTEYRP